MRLLFLFAPSALVLAQLGAVEVQVLDKKEKTPVPGTNVELVGKAIGRTTMWDSEGTCHFDSLTPGTDSLRISSIGYHPLAIPLQIKLDTITHVEVKLPVSKLEFPSYRTKKLPRNYVRKNTKITYAPIGRNK